MPCSSRTVSEKPPEIHKMEKYDFLNPMIIRISFNSVLFLFGVKSLHIKHSNYGSDCCVTHFSLHNSKPHISNFEGVFFLHDSALTYQTLS